MQPIQLGHIALRTPDLEKSIAFYGLLGAKVVFREKLVRGETVTDIAMIELGGFRIELSHRHGGTVLPNTREQNWSHLCIDTDDVDALVAQLKTLGVDTFLSEEPQNMELFGGIRNINLTGPSGEMIELSQNR